MNLAEELGLNGVSLIDLILPTATVDYSTH